MVAPVRIQRTKIMLTTWPRHDNTQPWRYNPLQSWSFTGQRVEVWNLDSKISQARKNPCSCSGSSLYNRNKYKTYINDQQGAWPPSASIATWMRSPVVSSWRPTTEHRGISTFADVHIRRCAPTNTEPIVGFLYDPADVRMSGMDFCGCRKCTVVITHLFVKKGHRKTGNLGAVSVSKWTKRRFSNVGSWLRNFDWGRNTVIFSAFSSLIG